MRKVTVRDLLEELLEHDLDETVEVGRYLGKIWSIKDARPGDILLSSSRKPFIFNGEISIDNDSVGAYGGIDTCNNFILSSSRCNWTGHVNEIKLTEPEHCEILFKKMKGAGYGWDGYNLKFYKLSANKVRL